MRLENALHHSVHLSLEISSTYENTSIKASRKSQNRDISLTIPEVPKLTFDGTNVIEILG